jgi:hypothetical protein
MLLCLQTIGDTVVMSPTSPVNMNGAIDSTLEAQGPIFLDHDTTVGAGETNINVLAQTQDLELQTYTGVDLNVRANTVVVAASHGLTDNLDLSIVIPIVQELIDVRTTGTFVGHTEVTFSGASDMSVRLKWHFLPHLAALLHATFPTGNSSKGLGTGDYFITPGLAASTLVGPIQLSARVAYDVDLSYANKSSIRYGGGASTLLYFPWLAGVFEFLATSGTGAEDPLIIFGTDYSKQHDFSIAFGLRAVLPHNFMAFVAGSYAFNNGGLRATGVFPTVGIGGRF